MKEGIQDKVLKKVLRIHNLGVSKIKLKTKGQKPFASQPVNPDELIYALESLGYDDPMILVQEYGQEAVNKLFYEISMMKQRRVKSGSIQTQRPVQGEDIQASPTPQITVRPQAPNTQSPMENPPVRSMYG